MQQLEHASNTELLSTFADPQVAEALLKHYHREEFITRRCVLPQSQCVAPAVLNSTALFGPTQNRGVPLPCPARPPLFLFVFLDERMLDHEASYVQSSRAHGETRLYAVGEQTEQLASAILGAPELQLGYER